MQGNDLLTLGVFLLVFACIVSAIMVARGDPDTRRLESRLRSFNGATGGAAGATAGTVSARNIRRTAGGSPLVRALEKFGRSRHIPQERRIPWLVVALACAAAAGGGAYLGAKIIGATVAPVCGLVAGALLVRLLFGMETSRYQTGLFRQLPDAMGMIMRALRAGLPMGEALANVARELESPSREEFAQAVSNITIGQPVDAALFGIAERSGLTEYYFFAVTVSLQAQTGGNLAETIDNLAEMVRKRVAMVARVKALTGEARMSAMILAFLPFVVGGGLSVMKPGHLTPLLVTDLGFRLLLVGGTMLGIGLLVIRGLVASATKD